MSEEKVEAEVVETTEVNQIDYYYDMKERDHEEIVQWIASAEEELADLRLRKALLEADFSELLKEYRRLITTNAPISTIAKTNLLDYFSYELLKPLKEVGLEQAEAYNTWESRHFLIAYQLDENRDLELNFKMDVVDVRFDASFMPLILVKPVEMTVEVDEKQVLELIHLWHTEKIFSRTQLSLINYDLNQLLSWFKELGFSVAPSLLDNTQALTVDLESELPLETKILDNIFITTMESEEYDFEKLGTDHYQVKLNQEQNVYIRSENGRTHLFVDSNNRRRSILDFFTHYPFLVPLIVRN
ncbi:hypothetical protein IV487_12335 [Enterococcus saccharolyticus]|uniref:hypothetical protein n=1 Tax=Enterococcus TaxID=1350 RepID=UPI001E5AEF48|nr:hypothetical protein [Enterococcus saccharolyticus]MCD5003252.1 hypothetical protein [Enterococcus saccharolyticus]